MKIVSACLVGINCRFNGKNKANEKLVELFKKGILIPLCPEQLGGLPTPRPPCTIVGGDGHDVLKGKAKVLTRKGEDLTTYFVKGAHEVLAIAHLLDIKEAILKSRSPSCGCGKIYCEDFTRKLRDGDGVTAALLKENGIRVYTERNFNCSDY